MGTAIQSLITLTSKNISARTKEGMEMISEVQYFLPVWVQILIGVAAATVAGGIIWKKLIQPAAKLVALMDTILPLLNELAVQFKDTPKAFNVLNAIIKEFRTDSGSTLRDVVNRLEAAAEENKTSSRVLATNAEAARRLSEQDRAQIAHLVLLLDRVSAKQRENIKAVDRIEAADKVVANDLSASQKRAGQVEGEAGAAADAAAKPENK